MRNVQFIAFSIVGFVLQICIARPCWGAHEPTTRITAKITDAGILIPAAWKGVSGYFVLDTGSSWCELDQSYFSDLPDLGTRAPTFTGHGTVDVELCKPPDLTIGPVSFAEEPFIGRSNLSTIADAAGETVLGILGSRALKNCVLQLDPDSAEIRFYRPDRSSHPEWGTAIPMKITHDMPEIELTVGGTKIMAVVDSGSLSEVSLPADLFQELLTKRDSPVITTPYLTMAGKSTVRHTCAPEIRVGGRLYRDLIVGECADSFGWIGRQFLSRHIVTLDFPNNVVYLNPAKGIDRRDFVESDPFRFLRIGNDLYVQFTAKKNPLEAAGVGDGDILDVVDGKPGSDWNLNDLSALLQSHQPRNIKITHSHPGDPDTLFTSIETGSISSSSRPDRTGYTKSVLNSLITLAAKANLELSSLSTSAADEFRLEVSIDADPNQGGFPFPKGTVLLVRDKGRFVLVVRNPDGTCGCYATESGTVLTLDPDRPGGIIYADGGYPRVIFSTDKSGVFLSHFAFVQESSLTQINFALDKLVQEAASVAKSAAFDEVTHTYAIDTPRTTVSLQLADPNSAFALKMFQIRGLAIRVRCTVPECGTLSDSSKRFFVDKYTIFKKLREKGVPIKVISGDALTADVMNNLIWQPDGTSAEDSRARATAALFAKLLFTDNTTSRTAESP